MIKKLSIYMLLLLCECVFADSYDEGKQWGKSLTVPGIEKELLEQVPDYVSENKLSYAAINGSNIDTYSHQAARNNEAINVISNSDHEKYDARNLDIPSTNIPKNRFILCQQGHCEPEPVIGDPNFAKSIAQLQAVESASKDMQEVGFWKFKHISIFGSIRHTCREVWTGYNNCCQDKGWGQDIKLAGCNSEEKFLAKSKGKGFCHYVGKYCSKKIKTPVGKKCTEHKRAYCCYQSKLARIVMESAYQQLYYSWGDGEISNCTGLTPEQLQKINFEKIDFTEYVSDVENQIEVQSVNATVNHIKELIG